MTDFLILKEDGSFDLLSHDFLTKSEVERYLDDFDKTKVKQFKDGIDYLINAHGFVLRNQPVLIKRIKAVAKKPEPKPEAEKPKS